MLRRRLAEALQPHVLERRGQTGIELREHSLRGFQPVAGELGPRIGRRRRLVRANEDLQAGSYPACGKWVY